MPPSRNRRRKEAAPPYADMDGPDHLRALPEGLIHHVLSLLPAHDAVRMCVLAKHWRDLWKTAPGLLVTTIKGFESDDKLDRFVRELLLQCCRGDSVRLESCDFALEGSNFDFEEILPHLSRWIRLALQCQVKVLQVSLGVFQFDDEECGYQLPYQPLSSQHLTTLHLDNVGTNYRVLDFLGCPALLNLNMRHCLVNSHMISSQSLQHLSMSYCRFHDKVRTRMALPTLVSMELTDPTGRAPLLESMPLLQTATINFERTCDKCADRMGRFDACGKEDICDGCYNNREPVDDHDDSLLLNGLSEATQLYLEADPDVYGFTRDLKWCPTFSKLKTLVLGKWCDLDGLISFLRHSPILERLTLHLPPLDEERKKSTEAEKSYNPLERSVASGLLQMVKIRYQAVDEMVVRILKMLNASGVPFDKISIQCPRRTSLRVLQRHLGEASVNLIWLESR